MTTKATPRRTVIGLAALTAVTLGVAACGDDGPATADIERTLPPVASPAPQVTTGGEPGAPSATPSPLDPAAVEAGRQVARDRGCAACHGANGQGGIGPRWIDLYGSEVQLEDGSVVIADEAYLTRSITDPGAEVVDGFTIAMPVNNLGDDEVAQLVAYLRSLGPDGVPPGAGGDS